MDIHNNQISGVLCQLKELSNEVIKVSEILELQFGSAGHRIAQAARQMKDTISEITVSNNFTHPLTVQNDSLVTERNTLPTLPPILDASLEKAVFTHPGVVHNSATHDQKTEVSYDRLEILGDAYLETMATRLIWDQLHALSAGRMSQVREELIKNETLADYATQYNFDKKVSVPPEYQNQPRRWMKTKADVFEAYVAAVILSDPIEGFQRTENWLAKLWLPRLASIKPSQQVLKYKEALAKKVMSKGIKLKYADERPPDQMTGGKQTFYIGVYLTGWGWVNQHLGSGSGLNKAMAGDEAAQQALLNTSLIEKIAAAKVAHDIDATIKSNRR